MPFDRILVPTDFSPLADHALAWAEYVAQSRQATLHLLHVMAEYDPSWFGDDDGLPPLGQIREQLETDARAALEQLAERTNAQEIPTETTLLHRLDVADTVLEQVREQDADLIVTGTHGRTGLSHMILGSVAEKIVRGAECPVLTVGAKAPKSPTIKRILAPIDFSDASEQMLRSIKELAAAYEARLDLLFVAEERTIPVFSDTGIPRLNRLKMDAEIVHESNRALEQLSENVGGPAVEVNAHVAQGNVPKQIVRFADTHEVDVIAMATRGLSGLDRLLVGSVTQRVMRTAPCPVLTHNVPLESHAFEGADSETEAA